jgi:hypothetical protein
MGTFRNEDRISKRGLNMKLLRDIYKRKPEVKLGVTLQKLVNGGVKWEGNEMQRPCIEEDGQIGLAAG